MKYKDTQVIDISIEPIKCYTCLHQKHIVQNPGYKTNWPGNEFSHGYSLSSASKEANCLFMFFIYI